MHHAYRLTDDEQEREPEQEAMVAAATGSLARKMDLLHHPNLSTSLTALLTVSDLKATHVHIITSGLSGDPFTAARLLASAALSVPGGLPHANSLFSSFAHPTLFMHNTMIRASSQSPNPTLDSAAFYVRMLRARISPDRFTFPFLLRSCSVLALSTLGQEVHSHVLKLGFDSDVFVANNAITMYAGWGDVNSACRVFEDCRDVADVVSWTALITGCVNCGEVDRARKLFDRMPNRNLVSWNAMIGGYAQRGRVKEAWKLFDQMPERNSASWSALVSGFVRSGLFKEALSAFREMIRLGFVPNEATLVSAVSACAQLRALDQGGWIHGYLERECVQMSMVLGTVLVDMYGKCGSIARAVKVFEEMPVKNIYSWNSMIAGLAMNGCEKQALAFLWKMQLMGVEPNAITFIGLLSACSHSGLVEEGRQLFETMIRDYGIRPLHEHYGCMVDLLGRAGLLKEAIEFVDGMEIEPHPGLWGALAGACRIHGNVELGEEVGKRLIELEPCNSGRYLLLANIYAAARRWDDMAMVKKLLKARRVTRAPGNSIVEEQSAIH